ncbi:MAG: 3-dehydroquinate synthase II [Deltaproteobacteria bacterium]|nr:3-dehydroquinate synthase II [Deltaproteobacteria bacterium]
MKTVWVNVDPWDKKLVTTALEGGADAVMVPRGCADKVRELGRITVIAPDGDLVPGEDVFFLTVKGQEDEGKVLEISARGPVVVDTPDWSIIPLENLVAQKARVATRVSTLEEAKTALTILEHGVWGVVADTRDPGELKAMLSAIRSSGSKTELTVAEITGVRAVGMGERVCVDTCTSMGRGQGMLVGNASSGLFLVHAESLENPYVAARPFRVNAGAVHAYTRTPSGRTTYLSELCAGDEVLVVDWQGNAQPAVVGRVKIEKRPLLLVTGRAGDQEISAILQNAETIRLVAEDGSAVTVVALEPGHKVLAAVEEGGRHFGYKIEETIQEK